MNSVGDHGSLVEYGINGLDTTATGRTEEFVDGGSLKHTQYIHRVRTDIQRSSQGVISIIVFIESDLNMNCR